MRLQSLGWFAILLLLVAIFRMVPVSHDRSSARAATPPVVTTIEPEESAAAQIEASLPALSVLRTHRPIEERVTVLEARSDDHQSMIDKLLTRQAETVDLLGRVVSQHETLHRTVLAELKQSAPDPKPPAPTAPPAVNVNKLPRKLLWFTAEWCGPCKAWGSGPDRSRIAADGCEIVPVDIDLIPPGQPRPPQVPYFELHIGSNFVRHSGPLPYQKFKDMERALLDGLKGAK